MTVFSVQVPLTPAYNSRLVNVYKTSVNLNFTLEDGEHTYTTNLQDVGSLTNFRDPVLQAKLTVWYSYNSLTNTITLCGNDLHSSDSTYLSTVPRGSNQYCKQHTYNGDYNPCGANENWNYCTPLSPGLMERFQQTVREANDLIIEKAREMDLTVIVRTPPPMLEASEFDKYLAVYENGKFLELHNPNKQYGTEHKIVNVGSAWEGEIYLNQNENFANVIGSTGDKEIAGKSWVQLWSDHFGIAADTCASLDYMGFNCHGYIVGGHVILGKVALNVAYGSNNVFIIPICTNHNNNDNVYMAAIKYKKGIALRDYHNP